MRIYLDCCALQRPFDDRSQLRIRMEAEAILSIISLFESGSLELFGSEALAFELDRMNEGDRKSFCLALLEKMSKAPQIDEKTKSLANEFVGHGIRALDALHLALACIAGVDYFCTCDDQFFQKATCEKLGGLKVVKPLQLVEEIENES